MPFATHILVPTDFSHAAELAVEATARLATQLGAKVTLVHVHDPDALRPPASLGYSHAQQERACRPRSSAPPRRACRICAPAR
ncbi:MAG: universal stress protein [Sandaracinaceae bacterium]|nr:universal stress protein [Sandaracinaceae bacterium]